MSKIALCFVVFFFCSFSIHAQKAVIQNTEFEQFTSRTGITVKFIDYNLPDINTKFVKAEARIRETIVGNDAKYFYQIINGGKNNTRTASIAQDDLLEIIKALQKLKEESFNDITLKPDYLENKFVTDDGFGLGYYVSEEKLAWFVTLQKIETENNSLFFNDVGELERALKEAMDKIELLKK